MQKPSIKGTNTDTEVVIGLEVHAQLLTQTKMFCGDSIFFGKEPNSQTSAISLAHPGTLPKINKEAISKAIMLGLAVNASIVRENYFARKNYFYPDLPKGYQISQHTTPICKGGFVEIGKEKKRIRLNRIHLEEDAGKSVHEGSAGFTQLDFNRAGTPLVEIVTEPDLRSAEEATEFVTILRKLVRHLGVCDGNMEEGSFRCDVNISVRRHGDETLGTKVEIKNLNSIKFIKKVIEFETEVLRHKLINNETILQQTKGFNEGNSSTYVIRTKEDEDDYRYFPEPDLPPFVVTEESIELVRQAMPPLPQQIKQELQLRFQLTDYDADQLANDTDLTSYFFTLSNITNNYKAAANWLIGPVRNYLQENELSLAEFALPAEKIAQLIALIDMGKISYGIATQKLLPALIANPLMDVEEYIKAAGLQLQSGGEVDAHVAAALQKHRDKIPTYLKGKKGLLSLFVGEAMRLSKGKGNAEEITKKILEHLK